MEELDQAAQRPVVLVAAPAGFGKTTMVTQWLASNRGPAGRRLGLARRPRQRPGPAVDPCGDGARAWPAADPEDDVAAFMAAHGGEVIAEVLPRLLHAMGEMDDDLVILLDDFHVLQDPACHRQVEFLVEHLPPTRTS